MTIPGELVLLFFIVLSVFIVCGNALANHYEREASNMMAKALKESRKEETTSSGKTLGVYEVSRFCVTSSLGEGYTETLTTQAYSEAEAITKVKNNNPSRIGSLFPPFIQRNDTGYSAKRIADVE